MEVVAQTTEPENVTHADGGANPPTAQHKDNAMTTHPLLLRLTASGQPLEWLHWQDAATLYCDNKVVWEAGETRITLYGGYPVIGGSRSTLHLSSIFAVRGKETTWTEGMVPPLSRRTIYERDRGLCLYCGTALDYGRSTLDHILPQSRGGRDSYANLVLACRGCNNRKRDRTPEEARMKLLATPYTPNRAEFLILMLGRRRILADQMMFLLAGSKHLR